MCLCTVTVDSRNVSIQALEVLFKCGHNLKEAWKAMQDTGSAHHEGILLLLLYNVLYACVLFHGIVSTLGWCGDN